jgi:phosphoglycerate dehydrogenase-like enzyme
MLILACAKQTLEVDRSTRKAQWRTPGRTPNMELRGKTLGIVGVGNPDLWPS